MSRRKRFITISEKIKSLGYRVFINGERTYGYYSDGKNVVSFSLDFYGGFYATLSLVAKKGKGLSLNDIGPYRNGEIHPEVNADIFKWALTYRPTFPKSSYLYNCIEEYYDDLEDFLDSRDYTGKTRRENLMEI